MAWSVTHDPIADSGRFRASLTDLLCGRVRVMDAVLAETVHRGVVEVVGQWDDDAFIDQDR